MRILGIDPGTARMGWGLVEGDRDPVLVAYGTLTTPAGQVLAERLLILLQELREVLSSHQPTAAALEEIFFARNVRTAFSVGQARGVALVAMAEAGLPVYEYSPLEVKQAVTGYGRAEKRQVQEMVRTLLSLDEIPRPDDAADALAVAICHFYSARMQDLLRQAES
ncbi:MAG: crossover junction endodeoxyribonuclease RuvC [Chloroflexia bacterium]|nr:crossover junction endodeoxyribonuclease RuvC [Chloroflexia bacterium]